MNTLSHRSNRGRDFRIRTLCTTEEREAAARLRYEVYVAELGRPQPCADHTARTIHEPLDEEGILLGGFDEGDTLVGTFRVAPSNAPSIECREIYGWEARERAFPGAVCHASKLLAAAEYRGTILGITLMREGTREALRRGWRFCFLETYDNLVPLYTGFVIRARMDDPVYGSVAIMVGPA
ncbi:MAG: hypothetical protein IPK67_16515 [Planctomycetes bacterium]|nr:hypothetical protein [Planctomycetota bacterium]